MCSLFAATVTRWLSESSGQVTLWNKGNEIKRGRREGGKEGYERNGRIEGEKEREGGSEREREREGERKRENVI